MPEPLLLVERLHKRFPVAGKRGALLHAVDDVSLHIGAGESLGLVGESGCGKSTLVRLLARLLDPTEGRIVFEGEDLAATPALRFARTAARARIQMVFQDPTDSLNPRYTARDTITEPLTLLLGLHGDAARRRVDEVAGQVGLHLLQVAPVQHLAPGLGAALAIEVDHPGLRPHGACGVLQPGTGGQAIAAGGRAPTQDDFGLGQARAQRCQAGPGAATQGQHSRQTHGGPPTPT